MDDLVAVISRRLDIVAERRRQSIRALEKDCGLTVGRLENVKQKGSTPGADALVAVSTVTGYSVDWLCGLAEEPRPSNTAEVRAMRDHYEIELAGCAARANKAEQIAEKYRVAFDALTGSKGEQ